MAQVVIDGALVMARRHRLCAALCLAVAAASACKEEGGIHVSSFSFKGTNAVSASQLKSVLATGASSKVPWGTKRYFDRGQFEADLKRIVAFYKDRGYPDARVTAFDTKLNDTQTSAALSITIAEGEPVRVEGIAYKGFDALPEQHRRSLESQLPLKVQAPLDRALLQASREAALDELKDHGFPYASVRIVETPGSSARLRAIAFEADAGPLTNFGPIEISGMSSVSETVVRRQLSYRPGRLFRQSALQESQRRLYTQELFQFANVEPVRSDGRPVEIPTRVTVTEGKHRKLNFAFGYGSQEKARAEIDWRHVNFFGGARTASVMARYSALDRGVRVGLRQPYFFGPRHELAVSAQSWYSDEPAYELTTQGGRVTLTRQFRRRGGPVLGSRPATTIALGYANEFESYTVSEEALADPTFRDDLIALGLDPETGKGRGTRSALSLDAARNTTDNLLDARRGYIASIHLEQAGQWLGGSYDYAELVSELRLYGRLGRVAVVAVQARAGTIDGVGNQDASVPFFKRYFLGGATNLRGWGRFEVAPLTDGGVPIGGASFVNLSAEVRAPVWRKLGVVLFVDGGNVWTNPWDFNLRQMRYDAGPGLRYATPIGPARLDVGYQLNPVPGLYINGEPESRRFRVHFSIGQAF